MKLKTLIQVLAFIVSLMSFGNSIWKHDINWFALSTAMYALTIILYHLFED